jgi:hypothetical protein
MPITNFDKVELLLPMTGANNGTTFTDWSLRRRVFALNGNPVTATAQSKFAAYGSSGYFNGSSYLSDSAAIWDFPEDFYVRTWVYAGALAENTAFCGKQTASSPGSALQLRVTSARYLQAVLRETSTTVTVTGTTALPTNTWAYIEMSRVSGTVRVFLNGTLEASAANLFNLTATGRPFVVGGTFTTLFAQPYTGYMQDFEIGKGGGGNTANYTPPARATDRKLTRASTGVDSHEYDRAVLFDWNAGSGNSLSTSVAPDSEGDFVASDLIDLEYGVALIKDGCGPICRGPVEVDPDA